LYILRRYYLLNGHSLTIFSVWIQHGRCSWCRADKSILLNVKWSETE
jgi:hypothetical protein